MLLTVPSAFGGLSQAGREAFVDHTPASFPSLLVEEFDTWQEDYAGAIVAIYRAGTTELLPCYSDPGLTQATANPQTLLTRRDEADALFGKFNDHVYVADAYELQISTGDRTGVRRRPIYSLTGEDASGTAVRAEGSVTLRTAAERAAEIINVLDWGALTESAATNTATLSAAIGAAAARGGGNVVMPAGRWGFNAINLPEGVILEGQGSDATEIFSIIAGKAITVTGDDSGLKRIMLDGVDLVPTSFGIWSKAIERFTLEDVIVRRFQTGALHIGGADHSYRDARFLNCTNGLECRGDPDTANGGLGDEFVGLDWEGGSVEQTVGVGLNFAMEGLPVRHCSIRNVDFFDNVGTAAIRFYGAQFIQITLARFEGNAVNWTILDNPDTNLASRECIGIRFNGGKLSDGTCLFDGLCLDVILDSMELLAPTLTMVTPLNNMLLRDCIESSPTLTGATEKLMRTRAISAGQVIGQTNDAVAATVWKARLAAAAPAHIKARVVAEQVNAEDYAVFEVSQAARALPAQLNFDGQTVNFTAGRFVQGQTSGATGIIIRQTDAGITGTLFLGSVVGDFIDNETITEVGGLGSAIVNGAIIPQTTELLGALVATIVHRSAGAAAWYIQFVPLGEEIRLQVVGAAGDTIVWVASLEIVVN